MTDTDALARNFSDTQVVLRGIAAARRDHGQPGPEQTWKELRRRCEIVLEDDRKALEFLFRQRVELMQGEQVGDSACDIAAMFTAQGMIEQAAFDDRQYWHRSTIERGRRLLPKRRGNESFELRHGKFTFHVSVGYYSEDDGVGEVFIDAAKAGTELEAYARDLAITFSIGRQYGAPLDVLAHALTRENDGSPSTILGAVADRLIREKKPKS
jgi:hypothetical protein